MRASKQTRRKTAFVPRILFRAATAVGVGVVPLCATACGGVAIEPIDGGGDRVLLGVAQIGFDGPFGVAIACFDGGTLPQCHPGDGGQPEAGEGGVNEGGDVQFTVAATCFDGGGFCPDAHFGVADVGFKDVLLGVAADAFGPDAGAGKG